MNRYGYTQVSDDYVAGVVKRLSEAKSNAEQYAVWQDGLNRAPDPNTLQQVMALNSPPDADEEDGPMVARGSTRFIGKGAITSKNRPTSDGYTGDSEFDAETDRMIEQTRQQGNDDSKSGDFASFTARMQQTTNPDELLELLKAEGEQYGLLVEE